MFSVLRSICWFLFFLAPAAAQSPDSMSPRLLFMEDGTPRAILLEELEAHVEIRGLLAETTLTMTFRNPHARILEGELKFPLPEHATVSGYGLDIDGELVDGVIVEQTRARVAFETEVRAGIDPGLVEWTRGNQFRTRVYPIPANGTRTIRVSYVSEIDGNADQAVYVLPMDFDAPIPEFRLHVEVVHGVHRPEVLGGLANVSFDEWEDRWVAETERSDAELEEDLRIALPRLPAQLVSIESLDEEHYFLIHDTAPVVSQYHQAPERVAIFWDASLSRENEDKTREYEIVRALMARWETVDVDLYVIRDTTTASESWAISNGDADPLIEALEEIRYDGGTSIRSLHSMAGQAEPDLTLLFSDGLHNMGHDLPEATQAPVYTITTRSNANHLLLGYIASISGGEHINLSRRTVAEAAPGIGDGRLRFMGLEIEEGEVEDVYPTGPIPVDERFEITGRLESRTATVFVRYGQRGRVSHVVEVELNRDEATTTGLVPRYWAQQRVAELAIHADQNGDELLALGRRHGLVTPNTSFLVLETLAQHLTHDIEPPESRPEMREAWLAHRAVNHQNEDREAQRQVDRLLTLWQARIRWWETNFTDWNSTPDHATPREPRVSSDPEVLYETGSVGAESDSTSMEMQFEDDSMDTSTRGESPAMVREESFGSASSAGTQRSSTSRAGRISNAPSPGSQSPPPPEEGVTASVTIGAWDPQTPYMVILRRAHERGRAYESYLDQRIGYGGSPAYFLDVATWFYAEGEAVLARRVLSSILDLDLDSPDLLRVVAHRLMEAGDFDTAISVFEDVLELRPEEPQSYRDLGLALARRGEANSNRYQDRPTSSDLADLERAMTLLHHVTMGSWGRFAEIELMALVELNRLWDITDSLSAGDRRKVDRPDLDSRLIRNLDLDLRISLVWDADLTDIDLWVTEPTGERAYYANRSTDIGGQVSRDFTQGYGPEDYSLRTLIPGTYRIEANYYGSRRQTLIGPTTVKAIIFTNYGRPNETREEVTLRLDRVSQSYLVATIELDEDGLRAQ